MKKYFVFSDVRSFCDELMTALNKAGFDTNNKDHILISLGNLCGEGPKTKETLSFINSLPEDRKCCVIGDGEIMTNLSFSFKSFATEEFPKDAVKPWRKYEKTWYWYYEIGDYIFVHGWIPYLDYDHNCCYRSDWRNACMLEVADATVFDGGKTWALGIREEGKTIFCGNWDTLQRMSRAHKAKDECAEKEDYGPFIDDGIVALDAFTADSHKVNVCTFEMEDNTKMKGQRWKDVRD